MEVTDKMYLSPPLGIHRMGSFLRKNGIECHVVDPTIEDIPDTEGYGIIGYSVLGSNLQRGLDHANSINKKPGQKIIFGGMEATFNYELIARSTQADAVILGEGELPVLHLCRTMDYSPYPGIVHVKDRNILNITLAKALSREEFEDLTVNMDYSHLPYLKYWEHIEAKRGENFDPEETRTIRLYLKNRCHFKCVFCSSTNFYRSACGKNPPVITIPPEKVVELMARLSQEFPGVRTFFFQDDEFFFPKKNIFKLCSLIQAHPLLKDKTYLCQGRVEAATPDLLAELRQSGFKKLILGIENFSPNILGELSPNKTAFVEKFDRAIFDILNSGIVPFINIILTSPGALMGDIIHTVDKCAEMVTRGAEIGMNLYCIAWAGSEMATRGDIQRDGLIILPNDKSVRALLKNVDSWFNRFLKWNRENGGAVKITSTTRSILYMLMINHCLGRSDEVERCTEFLSQCIIEPSRESFVWQGLMETDER
jgi:radical SAM superfamily enzyme YgiQ (UPF0313 family)